MDKKIMNEIIKFYQAREDQTSNDVTKTLGEADKLVKKLFKRIRRLKVIDITNDKEALRFYDFLLENEMKSKRSIYHSYKEKIRELKGEYNLK